ncbi:MAG: hypothetical protein NTX55_01055 [Candidatus Parcubacteria bacterium]|nr:hypothetical protein [Candidatus Parcubacteria bacterium]
MFYLIYGKDSFQGREKLKELTDFFQAKIGNLGIFRIEDEDFDTLRFEELIRSQMLFGKKHLVVCNRVLENTAARIFVKKNIERISSTPNIFLFFEEEIEKELLDLLKKYSEKTQEFKLKQGLTFKDYKPFAICDAVAERNKNRAWVLLQKALLSGVPAEEVFYKVVWQIKALLLIKKCPNETGLHPFVVQKNLVNAENFTEKELTDHSFELLKIYHNVRRGLEEFPLGLEKFLINL